MNDRIKELAEQTGMRTVTYEDGEETYFTESLDVQKFAELIIKECAEVAKETRWFVPPSQEQIARGIKQHFGVKE